MTRADFDARLDDVCAMCDRPYRWGECVLPHLAYTGTEPEAAVIGYTDHWLSIGGHLQAAMQLYATRWRGPQRMWESV
jgi:hypothetical protein